MRTLFWGGCMLALVSASVIHFYAGRTPPPEPVPEAKPRPAKPPAVPPSFGEESEVPTPLARPAVIDEFIVMRPEAEVLFRIPAPFAPMNEGNATRSIGPSPRPDRSGWRRMPWAPEDEAIAEHLQTLRTVSETLATVGRAFLPW